jgi:hypothetical protein
MRKKLQTGTGCCIGKTKKFSAMVPELSAQQDTQSSDHQRPASCLEAFHQVHGPMSTDPMALHPNHLPLHDVTLVCGFWILEEDSFAAPPATEDFPSLLFKITAKRKPPCIIVQEAHVHSRTVNCTTQTK